MDILPIPPHIQKLVDDEIDGEDLELFILTEHNNSSQGSLAVDFIDFINGFSMAIMYSYRNKVKEEDRKWVRIAISIKLRYALEKIYLT